MPYVGNVDIAAEYKMKKEDLDEKEKYESVWKCNEYRDFSPGEGILDKFNIIELLGKYKVKTVLDAGCGSGKLMRKLIDKCGSELVVHGFDIANNCLDPYFENTKDEILTVGNLWDPDDFDKEYDAIICTDVLEHIPTEKVPLVLKNFYRCTRKLCYLAIALFQDCFGPRILGQPLHLTLKEPSWWLKEIKSAGFDNMQAVVERNKNKQDIWLHVLLVK
jgi:2-polyprenyl-3-methyl-5-hydroxy-6-metoxy-1,4-benzoquinol methylase